MFSEGLTDQFKHDILKGVHQPGDTYKIALYTQAAATDKNASLKTYNTKGELPAVGGYKWGGLVLSGYATGIASGVAFIDWDDAVWANATFSADGAVIYNATRGNAALAVVDFGDTVVAQNGPFTIEFPAAGATSVITIR